MIANCQFYMNILPFELTLDLRRIYFLNDVCQGTCIDYNEGLLNPILSKYGFIRQPMVCNNWKYRMWSFFTARNDINL